jgi:transcriptional regulator
MHTNPAFRQTDEAVALDFARARGFGTLVMNGDPLPLLSHIPFLLHPDRSADLHLTRSNPIARAVADRAPALIAVAGGDGYVSPDWYGVEGQVPTWNYVAVHLVGELERRPDAELAALLDRLSEHFERRLAPKPVWRASKLEPQALARLMRMIVPFRFHLTELRSTFKLSQNKPDAARLAAAQALAAAGVGQELSALAALMAAPPATN